MYNNINIDVKTVVMCVGCFVLGNVYGTLTTMKATSKSIMWIKGNVIK